MSSNESDPGADFELTLKAVVLGVVLAVLLSAANAYLGLYAGMTVSASIPAAVLSMIVLRAFRQSNILENNLVQTAASAGEAVAAGAIFTLPALIILQSWSELSYWKGTLLTAVGGLIGVIFSVPLRRALILETDLTFPEGIATAEVLKTGNQSSSASTRKNFLYLFNGGLLGAAFKFIQSGLNIWPGAFKGGFRWLGTFSAFGISLSPALLGVGYIVGVKIALMIASGGFLAWGLGIPLSGYLQGVPEGPAFEAGMALWSEKIRFVGVGAMITGGLWSLVSLYGPIISAIQSGFNAYRRWFNESQVNPQKSDRDIPIPLLLPGLLLLLIPVHVILTTSLGSSINSVMIVVTIVVMAFVFSAVAGYMAGLVGSSNNPVSGVTIASILGISLLLLLLVGSGHPGAASTAILCGVVIACGAAISGDTMQDLKAGHLVGATPWKQQVMEFVGVLSASVVVVPIIDLLNRRYGIGPPGVGSPESLPAPQATLMASLAEGVFTRGLPWRLITIGVVAAGLVICLNQALKRISGGWRIHVLAFAVGLYLPIQLTGTIFIGGLLAFLVRALRPENDRTDGGVLVASGLITGEALVGILLALPLVLAGVSPAIRIGMFKLYEMTPSWGIGLGLIYFGFVSWYLSRAGALSRNRGGER
ncbi:MAG: OPT family oligopeptide transporter [bacterium]